MLTILQTGVNLSVSISIHNVLNHRINAQQQEGGTQMKSKRQKKHPEYFRIKAHQILVGISDSEMATRLGCTQRTYRDKISGWADFTATEAKALSLILGETQDSLFFTRDVSNSAQ